MVGGVLWGEVFGVGGWFGVCLFGVLGGGVVSVAWAVCVRAVCGVSGACACCLWREMCVRVLCVA